jgi:hypothetical protein
MLFSEPPSSLRWRTGDGEHTLESWMNALELRAPAERAQYFDRFPPPSSWRSFIRASFPGVLRRQLESLGKLRFASGVALIADTERLEAWSGRAAPAGKSRTEIDFAIEGPDAERAGAAFDEQAHPRYLFDIPDAEALPLQRRFGQFAREHEFDARLVALPAGVPHRERLELALSQFHGAGELLLHGISALAIGGLPPDIELDVLGERMGEGPFAEKWREVLLEVRPQVPVDHGDLVGHVEISMDGLAIADPDSSHRASTSTTWGGGRYPVHVELGAGGELVRVAIVLADEWRISFLLANEPHELS